MVLEIVTYGHPALRAKGRRIDAVDEAIRTLAGDMLETMADADGVGLAAQQVAMPLRLFVVDIRGVKDRPSQMWIQGQAVDPCAQMPLVLLNPEIETGGGETSGVEGCLSFPGITADISRPDHVRVRAEGLDGRSWDFEAAGLLGRALQHEFDHVEGILFIDRMSASDRKRLAHEIDQFLEG